MDDPVVRFLDSLAARRQQTEGGPPEGLTRPLDPPSVYPARRDWMGNNEYRPFLPEIAVKDMPAGVVLELAELAYFVAKAWASGTQPGQAEWYLARIVDTAHTLMSQWDEALAEMRS